MNKSCETGFAGKRGVSVDLARVKQDQTIVANVELDHALGNVGFGTVKRALIAAPPQDRL